MCGRLAALRDVPHWTVCRTCHRAARERQRSWHWQLERAVAELFDVDQVEELKALNHARLGGVPAPRKRVRTPRGREGASELGLPPGPT